MGLFIFAPILAFGLTFWFLMWDNWKPSKYDKPFDYNGFWGSLGVSGLMALIGLIAGMLLSLVLGATFAGFGAETRVLSQETKALYALADGNEISGSFFLGSGSIDDNMKYVYIVETEGKGYKMETVNINSAYVQYSDEEPTVTITSYVFDSEILNFLGVCPAPTEYIFRVPEGSITNSYVIDLE